MNKSILATMTALALVTGACGKKVPPADTGPIVTDPNAGGAGAGTNADDNVDLVELPGMQADLVAKAGSDTVYFGTDKSDLDDASRATLAGRTEPCARRLLRLGDFARGHFEADIGAAGLAARVARQRREVEPLMRLDEVDHDAPASGRVGYAQFEQGIDIARRRVGKAAVE